MLCFQRDSNPHTARPTKGNPSPYRSAIVLKCLNVIKTFTVSYMVKMNIPGTKHYQIGYGFMCLCKVMNTDRDIIYIGIRNADFV